MKARTDAATDRECTRLIERYAEGIGPLTRAEVVDRAWGSRTKRCTRLREQLGDCVQFRENAEASRIARMLVNAAALEVVNGQPEGDDDGE